MVRITGKSTIMSQIQALGSGEFTPGVRKVRASNNVFSALLGSVTKFGATPDASTCSAYMSSIEIMGKTRLGVQRGSIIS